MRLLALRFLFIFLGSFTCVVPPVSAQTAPPAVHSSVSNETIYLIFGKSKLQMKKSEVAITIRHSPLIMRRAPSRVQLLWVAMLAVQRD